MIDRRHQRILIRHRKSLEILGSVGDGVGDAPGQFYILHDMASDSHGNVYTAEIDENSRIQKFVFKGMAAVPIGSSPPSQVQYVTPPALRSALWMASAELALHRFSKGPHMKMKIAFFVWSRCS